MSRFHVALCLFSNRLQKISKCGKNIGDTLACGLCSWFFDICYHLWSNTEQLHGGMEYVILFNRFSSPRDAECLAQVRCQTRHELNLSFGKNADGHKIVFFLKGNKGSWATKQYFHWNFLVNFKLILDFLLGWTVHWIIALILVKFKGS